MIKTKFLLIAFTFSISALHSQNLLKSLYNLDTFPKEMEKSKVFIENTCSDILIYNYISGGNGSFQFDIKTTNELEIKLPVLNDLILKFLDPTTKEPFLNYTFHVDYSFKYNDYYDEFELNDNTFSLFSLFDLATYYYDLDEYSLVNKMLLIYKPELDYKTKRIQFFEILAKAFEIEDISDFKSIANNDENEDLFDREVEAFMLDAILEEIDNETINSQLFDYFILDKNSKTKTENNLVKLFNNKHIVNDIETNILQPKLTIDLYQSAQLHIPENYLTTNKSDSQAFPINSIEVRIDYKNHKLIIDFKNKEAVNLTLNDAFVMHEKEETMTSKNIRLEVSESDLKFQVIKFSPHQNIDNKPYVLILN
ncbi:hypothetical protein DFQ09_103368 [Winogradskyella pacifica]|uniref:Uncharacterized protein n=1 Tax=Winogradskyella pacifica TaxID=664642 RepID=A0A3D9MYD4_9FLAO|nr:hypothetical protein [Winogradskyella pacifica]REE25060.1 hypothetical protein DFQ09_103368 [Winogradskyella pacifica]